MKKIIKKIFDSEAIYWNADSMYNRAFLKHLENGIKSILEAREYVFLSEVYTDLGLKITRESCVFGWTINNLKNEEDVGFKYYPIEGTSDYELIFECYPILEYLEKEDGVV